MATIEPIIVVNQNETEVIKNKIINLSSIITVKGKLTFENCEINIFDNFVPLTLQTGILEFLDCQINAINENDSIIVKSDDDSDLNIYNSSIKTNTPLFEANEGNANVQDSLIDSQHRKLLNCKNINVINSELINSERDKLIGKYNSDNFLSVFAGNLKIENSVFKNLKNIFGGYESPYVIENSKFEDFCDLGDIRYLDNGGKITNTIINQIDEYLGLSNVAIENCEIKDGKFIDYEDLASNYFSMEIDNSNIKNLKLDNLEFVQFKECSLTNIKATNIVDIILHENNEFIESSFDNCYFNKIIYQGNKFFNSTFSNATIKSTKSSFKKQGFLDFTVKKSDFRDTKIEGCLFKNINVGDDYIINLDCHEKIKYKRHEISNCIFKDCNSENSSFVNLESFYFPKFSKKRKDIVLGVERDNIGIENLKK